MNWWKGLFDAKVMARGDADDVVGTALLNMIAEKAFSHDVPFGDTELESVYEKEMQEEGKVFYTENVYKFYEHFDESVRNAGWHPVLLDWTGYGVYYISDEGYFKVTPNSIGNGGNEEDGEITGHFSFFGRNHMEVVRSFVETHIVPLCELKRRKRQPISVDPRAFMLVKLAGDYTPVPLGIAGVPFVPENYAPDVSCRFESVSKELASDAPTGRLAILTGPTGSGKTFFVRSLMMQCPGAQYLYIPPEMIAEITGPEMVGVLISNMRARKIKTILVIEDADAALLQRGKSNKTNISILLNLTSGVIGELLDVRVVATSNVDYVEIDDALKRPGRMIGDNIHIGTLPMKQCQEIYEREGGKGTYSGPPYLAHIYSAAKG